MRRRLALSTVAVLTLTGTAACSGGGEGGGGGGGGSDEALAGLEVSGDFGRKPKLAVDGLDVDEAESAELIEGDGAEITEDSLVNYRILIASGKDGTVLQSSYGEPELSAMVVGQTQPLIKDAVVGTHIGSRVGVAAPVEELVGPGNAAQLGMTAADDVVLVFDLVEEGVPPLTGPKGTTVEPPADAPKIVEEDGAVTGLDFTDAPAEPPSKLEVIPLVEGDGEPVKEGDTISVNYLGTEWGDGDTPFDNSYGTGAPASFALTKGGLIDGWVQGLAGLEVGSRVMLVIPPELGYGKAGNPEIEVSGTDTLVFVIDVLGIQG